MRHIQNRLATVLSVIGAAALAVACGSEQQSKPPADDAETDSCTGGSAGTGATSTGGSSTGGSSTGGSSTGGWAGSGAACNTLANHGTVVHYEADPAPIPEMTGGPITDGTYVLTSLVHYAGVSADPTRTVRQTILVTGNGTTVEQVAQFDGEGELRRTISQAPAGNELNASEVCPEQVAQGPLPYTATPTSLTLVFEPANANLVLTYTLEPGCVSDGENLLCAPSGFPFVTRTFAVTDSCLGTDCVPPNPTLTQPESGTLCMSGTVPASEHAGFPLILFSSTPDFRTILQAFDADALGITDVSFTVDSPPEGGIVVQAGIVRSYTCETLNLCVGFGFDGPRITEAGTVRIPLADFMQSDPASPDQIFDTSSLAHIRFTVGEGPYDFCIRDFKFLNGEGDEVIP